MSHMPDPFTLRHVIIGSGEAGTRAALALRDAGARNITLIGAEAELPYERPPLSKPDDGDGVTIRRIAESFDGITTRFGVGVAHIDRAAQMIHMENGLRLPYDRLLLATGAQPRRLAEGTMTLRSRADAEAIFAAAVRGAYAVILGAGLIGLELAAELRKRGVSVTVLEQAPRAVGRALPAAIADVLVARHRAEGVDLRFGAGIAGLTAPRQLQLDTGEVLAADLIIAAIGVTPETTLAEAAGLPCGNGIHVNSGLATADPAIFAAGDCAATDHPTLGRVRSETWRNACDQGALAARAMLGEAVTFDRQPWFWSDQYDLGVQMVGLHDPARMTLRRDLPDGFLLFELDHAGRLAATSGISSGRRIAKDIRLGEMLIERGICPDPTALTDPGHPLKSLLRA